MPRCLRPGLQLGSGRFVDSYARHQCSKPWNLDTAITAMSALMIVMLVPSGRYGCGYLSSFWVYSRVVFRRWCSLLLPRLSSGVDD